jgi:hypothetical protein
MLQFHYGRNVPAMSNTERQRKFRERNPGYYGRLHAKRKLEIEAMAAARAAAQAAPAPLMLPAPIETIQMPGLTAIPTLAELHAQRDALTAAIERA